MRTDPEAEVRVSSVVNAVNTVLLSAQGDNEPDFLRKVIGWNWLVMEGESFVSVFYLSDEEMERVRRNREDGRHGFPGFFAAPDQSGVLAINDERAFFGGNQTSGGYAFSVKAGSAIIQDHRHTAKATDGTHWSYVVELAFVVALPPTAEVADLERAFEELCTWALSVWGVER